MPPDQHGRTYRHPQVPLMPASPDSLTGLAQRVYDRVLADDQP